MADEKERKFAKDFLEKWARAERERGTADEALVRVDEALKENPENPGLWFRRGSLLVELERWADALEAFRQAESRDPAFPRLNEALAFTLGKLGRPAEAAEAHRRAVADAEAGEAPLSPETALRSLAEELSREALEEEAVERLEELEGLAPPPEPPSEEAEEFASKLRAWEEAGYDVAPLRDVLKNEPDRARTAFFQFEQNVRKIEVLRETVDALDPRGVEGEIARVRALFRAPYQIWKIEAEMATVMEKADARDRAQRARTAPSPREPMPGRGRAIGATNGGPPTGRTNGLVNGTRGRTNGLVNGTRGRTNGLVNGTRGRTNGLVNGVGAARAGLTNGLTNGLGFTNGLGGLRYAAEIRARRSRLLLVPVVAVLLLSITAIAPPPPAPVLGGVSVDGSFGEWDGMPGYTQPSTASSPSVDLLAYKVRFQDNRLSVYASVNGTVFEGTPGPALLWIFVDVDGNPATGYDEGRIGAELLLGLQGENGTIERADVKNWSGGDRSDWNGWGTSNLPFVAAASGSAVEGQVDLAEFPGFDPGRFSRDGVVSIHTDDQAGARSASAVLAGPTYGALVVTQGAASPELHGPSPDFLVLAFHAIGTDVRVRNVTFALGSQTRLFPENEFFTIPQGEKTPVTFKADVAGVAAGTLLTASVASVDADRPVTITGDAARAYVETTPAGPVVDGLFGDWTSWQNDPHGVADPNLDVLRHAGEAVNTTAFAYVRVGGTALGGTAAPIRRLSPGPQGGPASAPGGPAPPEPPRFGDDLIRIFYAANGTAGGTPIGGIVANAYLEVHGRYGRVRGNTSYRWAGQWIVNGTAGAIAVGDQFEAYLDIPGVELRGAQYVVETRDWRGSGDSTQVAGVRGTRSSAGGVTFFDSYQATLPWMADGWFRFSAPGGLGISWRLPALRSVRGNDSFLFAESEPTPLDVEGFGGHYPRAYSKAGITVAYEARPDQFKETFTIPALPGLAEGHDLLFDLPLLHDADLMTYAEGETVDGDFLVNGSLSFVDGRGLSVSLQSPWASDASGARVDLRFRPGAERLAFLVPGSWLRYATYPVILDPTVTYTLRNDGFMYKAGEQLGASVAVGDFNNDGYADALMGAPQNSFGWSNNTAHGAAYIYYGPFSADKTTPDVSINGTGGQGPAKFGISVVAGRFNNDNYWDALVGRISNDIAGSCSPCGTVQIYYGSSSFDTTVDVQFQWPSSPRNFGTMVGAGNLDNANYDDVLIGEPGRDLGTDAGGDGVVYVYMSPFGSSETSSDYRLIPSGTFGQTNGQLGKAIATSKIDSDAYADVVVGELNYNTNNGRVQFYKGSHFTSGSGDVSPDATLDSPGPGGENFGTSVAAGTLNGDAYADVVVGAPASSSFDGAVYVFLANSDGTGLTSGVSPDVTILGVSASVEQLGRSVLVIDFDSDGTNDIFAGAPTADAGGTDRGSVYWYDEPLADQTADATFSGSQTSENFGFALAGGRFSSDSQPVVLIGAYLWDKSGNQNDGRGVVAMVPETVPMMLATVVILGLAARSLQRRRLVRKRRKLRLEN